MLGPSCGQCSKNVVCCAALAAGIPGGQGDLELVEVGVRCSLEQMLEEGFYHSDPHPGNLLHTQSGQLAYIDFGEQRPPLPAEVTSVMTASSSVGTAVSDWPVRVAQA